MTINEQNSVFRTICDCVHDSGLCSGGSGYRSRSIAEEVVKKLKHADSPDAEAEKVQFDLPIPEVEPGKVELKAKADK